MTSIKKHMEHMKEEIKEGMHKVGSGIKHTADGIKNEAKSVISDIEDKKDELIEEYKEEEYARRMEKQAKEDKVKDNKHDMF